MNDQPEPPPNIEPPPSGESAPKPLPKILWLFAAFIPSLAALAAMPQNSSSGPGRLQCLFVLDVICSLAASIGLVRGMKSKGERIAVAIFLTGVFFTANLVVAVLIGCSHMAI